MRGAGRAGRPRGCRGREPRLAHQGGRGVGAGRDRGDRLAHAPRRGGYQPPRLRSAGSVAAELQRNGAPARAAGGLMRTNRMRAFETQTAAVVMAAVAVVVTAACGSGGAKQAKAPPLTQEQLVAKGRSIFQTPCAPCHGTTLNGTSMAPSMIQAAFAPDQTPDQAFFNAIRHGVPQKRFQKGPMPPQPSVATADIPAIVAYVRSVQAQNGITSGGGASSTS